ATREEAALRQEAKLRELAAALSAREGALVERERALTDREEIVLANEQALTEREQALAQREQALARLEALLDERLGRGVAVTAPGPDAATSLTEPVSPRVPAICPYDLSSLDALVHERAHEFPEQLDEWRAYLFHLREFVDERGLLPASFDGLVAEVFADLLAAPRGGAPTGPRPSKR
ncbi:MAG: hypothetical protein M3304_06505, partial [Actinomycetota bacterium]|nr:hypothetical protein [Actinomycetota bacterium]